MQALILAGGQGTRLRPLTLTVPKPVMPLAGRPFLSFMLDWLARHGVEEAILSCGFRGDDVARVLGDRHGDVELLYVHERDPLGTAGPVRLAADQGVLGERVLVLNGDILTDFDLSAEIEFHACAAARATLALMAVEDTSSYGLVPTGPGGEVEAFLEKGKGGRVEALHGSTNRVNAGAYVLDREVIEEIPPGRPVSFEREVFPGLVGRGLYGHHVDGYWIDIGTPERYLEATHDLLRGTVESSLPPRDETGSLVAAGCRVAGAEIGPLSVLGEGCRAEPGARVAGSALHREVKVGRGSAVIDAIVADQAAVEAGARVEAGAVVGAGARVSSGATVPAGARVDPETVVGPAPAVTGRGPERGGAS
jgi:mannose-1-phosphate guanylyltransferase